MRRVPTPRPGQRRLALASSEGRGVDAGHGLDELTALRMWSNPCWLSGRLNYLALHFNVPAYGWIARRFKLMRPDFVVLYSLGLKDGVTAQAITISTGFPKNTISRAVQKLLRRKVIRREADRGDARSLTLWLTRTGREILAEAGPVLVERERTMIATLSADEQRQLADLLAKLVIDSPRWQPEIDVNDDTE